MKAIALSNRLADLLKRLEDAVQKLSEAKKALRVAERKEECASDVIRTLQEEIAMEKIRVWKGEPDLTALLASNGPMVFYQVLSAIAESKGFHVGGEWSDTKQLVLSFGFNRSEIGAIERVAAGIGYFAPAMKPIQGGWVKFFVNHRDSESCAWQLHYSKKRGDVQLVRMVYCHEDEPLNFGSLGDALLYVETNLWLEDIIDAMPVAALA